MSPSSAEGQGLIMVPIIRVTLEHDTLKVVYLSEELDGLDAVFTSVKNPKHAQAFMEAYRKVSPNADTYVGYCTGYYPYEKRMELCKRFGVMHPVFGERDVSPDEALQMGMELGKAARDLDPLPPAKPRPMKIVDDK